MGRGQAMNNNGLKKDTQEIYPSLQRKIIEFTYRPGDILNELDLAEEYGVSRTPVRAALQELERDNLIIIVPRYGAQVASIDFRAIGDLFEVTKRLDPYAARLAVKRITPQQIQELKEIVERLDSFTTTESYQDAIIEDQRFHDIIFEASRNRWLVETSERLHIHTERLWHYCKDYFDDMEIFTRTFKLILKALEDGDGDAAEKYAADHIDDFLSRIRESLF